MGKALMYISPTAILAACVLILTNSSYVILLKFSANDQGKYDYNTRTVVFFAEVTKAALSSFLLLLTHFKREEEAASSKPLTAGTFFLFAAPGFLYFINNNVPFYCLMYVDAGSYQVLNQLKVLTTAISFRIMLGKQLTPRRWGALMLLMVGCGISQMKNSIAATLAQPPMGYVLITTMCTLSAIAAVYSENLLKNTGQSIHLQNLQMYAWGVFFSFLGLQMEGASDMALYTAGYSTPVFLSIIMLSMTGLMTSAVMKYADNMIKLFALACSMFFVMFVSSTYFKAPLTPQLGVGGLLVSVAFYFYTVEPPREKPKEEQPLIQSGGGANKV